MAKAGSPAPGHALGLHRVIEPAGVLPQAAWRLDADPVICPDEVRLRLERLNLDAASFRQLTEHHQGDGAAVRRRVAEIVAERGKMHNPVTGSGGMLVGVVDEVGPASPLGLRPGERVATLVSLTLTPLRIDDALRGWDGLGEQVPASGHAILFARSVAAALPADLPTPLAIAVLDVCGAAALTARVVAARAGAAEPGDAPSVTVIGAAGKSGSLALAAARRAGAGDLLAVVRDADEAEILGGTDLADRIVVADARDPLAVLAAVSSAGGPGDITVVCVDVAGAEHGAILATRDGGTVVFFAMSTSFPAAALGAEGVAADVTMLIGNGYAPGHSAAALELVRGNPDLRRLFERRLVERRGLERVGG